MSRQGENIRKRKDNRWEARVLWKYRHDGKKIYKYIYGKSYEDVFEKKKQYIKEYEEQEAKTASLCLTPVFQEVSSDWMKAGMGTWKASTFAVYSSNLERYLLPRFGSMTLMSIDNVCIDQFLLDLMVFGNERADRSSNIISEIEDQNVDCNDKFLKRKENLVIDSSNNTKGLSKRTVGEIRRILLSILKYASKKGYIAETPECMSITNYSSTFRILSKMEQIRLEGVLYQEDTPFSNAVLLTLYSGIRNGEVCALQWKDFDSDNGTITVSKTVIRIKNVEPNASSKTKVIIQDAKTNCSKRIIPLPDDIADYLRLRKMDDDIYIATGTSKFIEPRLCLTHYKKLLKLAGIRNYTYHDLRHTYATRCVEEGVDPKIICENMGHSDVKTTLQRYVHPTLSTKKEQVNKLCNSSIRGQIRGQHK